MLKNTPDQVCSVNCFGVSQAVIVLYTVYPGKIAAQKRYPWAEGDLGLKSGETPPAVAGLLPDVSPQLNTFTCPSPKIYMCITEYSPVACRCVAVGLCCGSGPVAVV